MIAITPNSDRCRERMAGQDRKLECGTAWLGRLVPAVAMCCCVVLVAGPALAQQSAPLNVTVRAVDDSDQNIRLALGKSVLLDVDQPMTRASVAIPEVADVVIVTPKQALLTGQSVGITQILSLIHI